MEIEEEKSSSLPFVSTWEIEEERELLGEYDEDDLGTEEEEEETKEDEEEIEGDDWDESVE